MSIDDLLCGASNMPSIRSEEHTSELQSLRHLVCRLLLEKKDGTRTVRILLGDSRPPRASLHGGPPAGPRRRPSSGSPRRARASSSARRLCFFFNDTATTEIYTLSLHDALPISPGSAPRTGNAARCCNRADSAGSDRKSTRLNSSHLGISYAVFCLKKRDTR